MILAKNEYNLKRKFDVKKIQVQVNAVNEFPSVFCEGSKIQQVLDLFFTTKGSGKGTGFGLSISYFIVTEDHKGKMDLTSVPGKGSCFAIRLPIHG